MNSASNSATVLVSNRGSWKNRPLFQTRASQEDDDRTLPNFETIRPIQRNDIPLTRGRGSNKGLRGLQIVREFGMLLSMAKERGINPYEIAAEIDMTGKEVMREKARRKSFTQSFRVLLREIVKQHGMSDKIDVVEYNRGEQFFIVGRAS